MAVMILAQCLTHSSDCYYPTMLLLLCVVLTTVIGTHCLNFPIAQCTYTRVLHWVCRSYLWFTQTPKKIQYTGGAISVIIMIIVLFVNACCRGC
jgi:hypothetical protein